MHFNQNDKYLFNFILSICKIKKILMQIAKDLRIKRTEKNCFQFFKFLNYFLNCKIKQECKV